MDSSYEIARATKEQTTKCQSGCLCLSSPKDIVCEAEHILNNDLLFVKKVKNRLCPYFLHYGDSGACLCPVRKELFKKYRV